MTKISKPTSAAKTTTITTTNFNNRSSKRCFAKKWQFDATKSEKLDCKKKVSLSKYINNNTKNNNY